MSEQRDHSYQDYVQGMIEEVHGLPESYQSPDVKEYAELLRETSDPTVAKALRLALDEIHEQIHTSELAIPPPGTVSTGDIMIGYTEDNGEVTISL